VDAGELRGHRLRGGDRRALVQRARRRLSVRPDIRLRRRRDGRELHACAEPGAERWSTWKEVSFNVSAYAGQTLVFRFNDHDDGRAADPTYVLVDDVAVT
jgi:hypothetical protein